MSELAPDLQGRLSPGIHRLPDSTIVAAGDQGKSKPFRRGRVSDSLAAGSSKNCSRAGSQRRADSVLARYWPSGRSSRCDVRLRQRIELRPRADRVEPILQMRPCDMSPARPFAVDGCIRTARDESRRVGLEVVASHLQPALLAVKDDEVRTSAPDHSSSPTGWCSSIPSAYRIVTGQKAADLPVAEVARLATPPCSDRNSHEFRY